MKNLLIFLSVAFFSVVILSNTMSLSAQSQVQELGCTAPYYIPSACKTPYVPGRSAGYTADLNCQLERISNPASRCCPNYCVDSSGEAVGLSTETNELVSALEVFNTTIKVSPDNLGVLINILFSTVLGLVSLYTIIRGIYVTGVKRPMATSADDIANLNKELTNLIIGAVICWGFIILIQVVANLFGVGQLNSLDISGGEGGGTVIVIQ